LGIREAIEFRLKISPDFGIRSIMRWSVGSPSESPGFMYDKQEKEINNGLLSLV
jgi:hypothetical protein